MEGSVLVSGDSQVVSNYKYQDLKITDTLDYEAMVKDRVAIARKTLGMLKRFFVNCVTS